MAYEKKYVTHFDVLHNDRYDFDYADCYEVAVSQEQLNNYAQQLKDYLIKIDVTYTRSYDNSDDDRVTDSFSEWRAVRYCEIQPLENSKHLLVKDDKVVGVVFHVRNNRGDVETQSFLFDGSIQEKFSMGYSASHSSSWTSVDKVTLVKRGQDGAPTEGGNVDFSQSHMYPSI